LYAVEEVVLDLHAKAGHQRLQSGAGRPGLALAPRGTAFSWDGPDLLWASVLQAV